MIVDFDSLELKNRYKIMSRTIIPRPIAWIVTEGKAINIAPFSYFMALSSNPATLVVSIGHKKDGSQKDTLKNILHTKRCTICSVTPKHLMKMHQSSESLEYDESEAEQFGIETLKVVEDFPPMVQEAPTALFCTLYQTIELPDSKTIPLILEIQKAYIDDNVTDENFNIQFDPVARIGREYALCDRRIQM